MIKTSETQSFALKLTKFLNLFFSNVFGLGECKIHVVLYCCCRKLLFHREEHMNRKRNMPLCSHSLENFGFLEIGLNTINTLF